MSDQPRFVTEPDERYTPEIKRHSLEKIRLHNRYARIFATAMGNKWPQLAYIGLYSGAGHARLKDTGDVVETSAMAVLRQPKRFTDYIYVDRDPRCTDALRHRLEPLKGSARVTILQEDVNGCEKNVLAALPPFSAQHGLLCFCFVDPFDLSLKFSTIRALAERKVDFLILLMLGVDWRRNLSTYLRDEQSTRIDELIDCSTWRAEYTQQPSNKIHFLLRKFDEAMQRLGYLPAAQDAHTVNVFGKGVLQYVLAFYSRNPLGKQFWQDTRNSLSSQIGLDL